MIKKVKTVILALALLSPGTSFALDCDVYHEAISQCAARDGCDTTIDAFSSCLIEEQGISEHAEDGTNEVEELIHCFKTEYQCQ